MAKYQSFLSRVGSNRDRAALRGIFSMFLTDGDPPALKDLVLASIILSGAETTQITISGTSTTGIAITNAATGINLGTSATAGIAFTGTVTKGINFASATPAYASSDDAFIAIGTYNDGYQVANTASTSFIPIQVNLHSTGTAGSAGQQVAAARLRVNNETSTGANTAIHVLQLRSDIAQNCYAAACLNASMNVSGNVTVAGETVQCGYFSITGAGVITCSAVVNVLEASYRGTSPSAGVDNVCQLSINASGCAVTSILSILNTAGTATNGINIAGACTTAISIASSTAGAAILIGGSSADPVITTSTGTTNLIDVNGRLNAASGSLRGVISYVEFSGTAHTATSMNIQAVRGYAKVAAAMGAVNAFVSGIQGKIEVATAFTGGNAQAILAQINSSAGAAGSSNGILSGIRVDSQLTATPGASVNCDMILITQTVSTVAMRSMLYMLGGATYAFAFEDVDNATKLTSAASTKSSPGTVTGWVNINVNGAARYIPFYSSMTS